MAKKKEAPSEETKRKFRNKRWRMKHLYSVKNRAARIVPYVRNRAQAHFTENRWYFNIILKSRRLGFSTEVDLSLFDDTLFNPYDTLIIAHTKDDAEKLFDDKIMTAWMNLPQELKDNWKVDSERANRLKFDWGKHTIIDPETKKKKVINNFSSITVSNSGRSGGYTRVHISEFGPLCERFPARAAEIISGTIPTIPYGGQLDIESTAESDYGFFHDMFWDAWNNPTNNLPLKEFKKHNSKTTYKAHFYNWTWDDEELSQITTAIPTKSMDDSKYFADYQRKHKLTDLQITYYYLKYKSLASDKRILRQQYPMTPEEAFENAGDKYFDQDKIAKQLELIREPIRVEGAWQIFHDPVSSHDYTAGIDSSEGIGGDNATIAIIDLSTKPHQIVATFKNNHTPPDMLAHEAKIKGFLYNTAFMVPEVNNHGHVVVQTLKDIYPTYKIFTRIKQDRAYDEQTEKLGFQTNIATRSQMFTDLNSTINETSIILTSKELIHEFKTFPRQKVNQVRTKDDGTLGHWDLLTATALAFQGRHTATNLSETPKTYIIGENPDSCYTSEKSTLLPGFNPFEGI